MNKKITLLSLCLTAASAVLVLSSYSGGMSTENFSGSPGSNGKCNNNTCHTNNQSQSALLNVAAAVKGTTTPTTTFKVGTTYNIAIAVTNGSSTRRGTNSTVVNNAGASVGSLATPSGGKIITANGVSLFTHSPSNAAGIFAYEWTPDMNTPDTVKVYTTAIAANGNGNNQGDQFMESVSTLVKDKTNASAGIEKSEIHLYPNPCVDKIKSESEISGAIYSLIGQKVMEFTKTKSIDISTLESGKYFVTYSNGQSNFTKAIIKL